MAETTTPGIRFLFRDLPPSSSRSARAARILALAAATVGPLVAAGTLHWWDSDVPAAFWVPVGLLIASAVAVHHAAFGSQMFARSVWWANFLLGCLISVVSQGHDRMLAGLMVLGTGVPLLAMGQVGLGEDSRSRFQPVAFRTTLTVAMTMAVADAQAFLFWGTLELSENVTLRNAPLSVHTQSMIMLGITAGLAVSLVGLYRLRVWGLFLAAFCGVGTIGLFLGRLIVLPTPLPEIFIATAVVQLLLPVPVFVAITRGKAPPVSPSRWGQRVPAFVVAGLLVTSLARDLGMF